MTDSPGTGAEGDVRKELNRLQERLAYYESFDQLIQKSVSDAGDILREAIEMRESASRDVEAASRTANAAHTLQLETYRSLFSEMLDEITQLQGHAERLARRLTDAIDAVETQLLPDVEFPNLPTSLTPEIASTIEATPEDVAVQDDATKADIDLSAAAVDATVAASALVESETGIDEAGGQEIEEQDEETAELSDPGPETFEALPEGDPGDSRFVLLVHGVPNAALALSLKSFLEALEGVQRVEPREFAAGLLRLQLLVERNLDEHDLAGWSSGKVLQAVHARPGLLEVKLS